MEKCTKIALFSPLFLLTLTWVFSFNPPLTVFFIKNIFPYDLQRLLQLLFLVVVAIFGMSMSCIRNTIVVHVNAWRRPTLITIILFFWAGLISCLFAKAPTYAFLEWSLFILLTFSALCFSAIASIIGDQFYYLLSAIIFIVIASYIYPVCHDYMHAILHHQPIYLFPYFIDKRFFSQFAVFTIGLLPLLDDWAQKKSLSWMRLLLFLLAAFWWTLILINGSRGLILSVIIAIILATMLYKKAVLPWLWRQCCFLGTAILAMLLLIVIIMITHNHDLLLKSIAHLQHFNAMTFTPRIILYNYAIHLTIHHPWLGVGPMHFAYAPPPLLQKDMQLVAHPHNFILLIFSEWGIFAGAAFLFVLLCGLTVFIRKNKAVARESNSEKNLIHISCLIAVIAGLCDALVSGVFVMPLAQTILAVTVGSAMALCIPKNTNRCNRSKNKWVIVFVLTVILIFSIYMVITTLITTLPNLLQSEVHWLSTQPTGLHTPFNPRFWLQGWINGF